MTPKEYAYDKAAPSGSTLYFSLRRLTTKQRDAIVGIYAFYHEIEQITLMYEDANTAHIKLNWWRDQVIKIQDAKPDHPLAVFLQESFRTINMSALSLIEIIDGLEQNLTAPIFPKFEDVMIHIMRTAGVREKLIAEVLQNNNNVSQELLYQIAFFIEFTHYIQHLRHYVRHNVFYFSQDELQKFSVSETEFHEFVTTKNIRDLLQFQFEKLQRAYLKIQESISSAALANAKIRCEVSHAILNEIQKSNYTALESFIDLTPLRKWWIALMK